MEGHVWMTNTHGGRQGNEEIVRGTTEMDGRLALDWIARRGAYLAYIGDGMAERPDCDMFQTGVVEIDGYRDCNRGIFIILGCCRLGLYGLE